MPEPAIQSNQQSEHAEHFFNGHNNARLTFVIGIVLGMTLMTVGGIAFFFYVMTGGEIKHYEIEPLDTSKYILQEPISSLDSTTETPIVLPGNDYTFGAESNYKVTLVQYVDYECPFCKKFYPAVEDFVNKHSDTVRLIVKQYPLVQIHPNAKTAAAAAYCAGQQGKLGDYSQALFAHQAELSVTIYQTVADELELDLTKFQDCYVASATTAALEADSAEALRIGVRTQPNLVIWNNDGTLKLIDGYVNETYLTDVLQPYL